MFLQITFKRLQKMAKQKQKKVYDKEKAELQKALRIPTAKRGFTFKDKKKYSRKLKHKLKYEETTSISD